MIQRKAVQDAFERFGASINDAARERRRLLRQSQFTIVSNDCWGAEVYKDLGLPYATPLIGTFLLAPCYMAVARDARRILTSPLTFIEESRYADVNERRRTNPYPIGLLADGVEIQFLHYSSVADAAEKWARRLMRSHFDRLFFKLSADKDGFTDADLVLFDALPIKKIALSAKAHPELASVVTITDYTLDGKAMYPISIRNFDIIAWLNG